MKKNLADLLKERMGYTVPSGKQCNGCKFFRLIDGFVDRTWEGRCDYWQKTTPCLGELEVQETAVCGYWTEKPK